MPWLVWAIVSVVIYLVVGAGVARLRYHLIDTGQLWQMKQPIKLLWEGEDYNYPADWRREAAKDRNATWAALWPFSLVWESICLLVFVILIGCALFVIAIEFVSRPLRNLIRYIWRQVFLTATQR